jgi:hypothetical protein
MCRIGCPQNLQEFRLSSHRNFDLSELAFLCPLIRGLLIRRLMDVLRSIRALDTAHDEHSTRAGNCISANQQAIFTDRRRGNPPAAGRRLAEFPSKVLREAPFRSCRHESDNHRLSRVHNPRAHRSRHISIYQVLARILPADSESNDFNLGIQD